MIEEIEFSYPQAKNKTATKHSKRVSIASQ